MLERFYKASSPLKVYRGKYPLAGLVLLCLACSGCASFRSCGNGEGWFGQDKAKHFAGSALIGGSVTAIAAQDMDTGEAVALGYAVAMSAGIGKEVYDLNVKNTCWSWKDLVWDFLGASVGITIAAQAAD